jgi:hypothetical protein
LLVKIAANTREFHLFIDPHSSHCYPKNPSHISALTSLEKSHKAITNSRSDNVINSAHPRIIKCFEKVRFVSHSGSSLKQQTTQTDRGDEMTKRVQSIM